MFKNTSNSRIIGLDIIRFIAVSFVLIEHGRGLLRPLLGPQNFLYICGFFGVEMFFVLSGFLIGGILLTSFEKNKTLNFNIIKDFWIRRWFRTLPLYYLILLLNLLVELSYSTTRHNFSFYSLYFTFTQNAFYGMPSFFPESWSLSVEEWFYFSFPLTLLLVQTINFKVKITVQKKYLITIIVFLLLISAFKLYHAYYISESWVVARKKMPLRLDSILIGVLFSWLHFYFYSFLKKNKMYFLLLGSVLCLLSSFIYFDYIFPYGKKTSVFNNTFYFLMTDIAFALFIPFCFYLKLSSGRITKAITHISTISYSLYLLHYSVVIPLINQLGPVNSKLKGIVLYILYWSASIILATLLYRFFELPITKLRDRFKQPVYKIKTDRK